MTLYKVKKNSCIEDGGKRYTEGAEIELSSSLALFHASNIEPVSDSTPLTVSKVSEKTEKPSRQKDAGES